MRLQPITRDPVVLAVLCMIMGSGSASSSGQGSAVVRTEKSASSDGLQLVLSVPERARTGQPLPILVALINQTHEYLVLLEPQRYAAFDVTVSRITKSGPVTVTRTALGRRVLEQTLGSAQSVSTYELLKGYGIRYELNLAGLFDVTESGMYAVAVFSPKILYPRGLRGPSIGDVRFFNGTLAYDAQFVRADGTVVEDVREYGKSCRAKSAELSRTPKAPN